MQNEKKISEALHRAAMRSLETLCFVFSSPLREKDKKANRKSMTVEVKFQGFHTGRLILKVSQDIIATLTKNMIGEKEVTGEQQRDAMGEIANVICGNFLPEVFGRVQVFEISAPVVKQTANNQISAPAIHLAVESGRIDIILCLDKERAMHTR